MTQPDVRGALIEAIQECEVVGNVVIENGRPFVEVSIDKIANELAPKVEAALRETVEMMAFRVNDGFYTDEDMKECVTAGIGKLSNHNHKDIP